MMTKPLSFPAETYEHDRERTKKHPSDDLQAQRILFSGKYCLPNEDGEFRRYSVWRDNEGYLFAHYGGTDTYELGAVACPTVIKCAECPLRT